MGPATYDLASLLRDSYVDLDEEFVAERAEEFRQRAVPGESRDTFRRRFDLMSIQRNLKALGTFGYMAAVRGSRVYLPYIPRTLASARRNLVALPGAVRAAPRAGAPPRGAAVTEHACASRDFRGPRRPGSAGPGLAAQQALQRQAAVPDRARRQRLRAGGGGQGGGAAGGLGRPRRAWGRSRRSSSRAR